MSLRPTFTRPRHPSRRRNARSVCPSILPLDIGALITHKSTQYFDVISAWGSWAEFQTLLHTLRAVADVHSVDISNVGTRWVLQRPEVAAVIVGSRLGLSSHAEANCRVFTFVLSEEEVARIEGAALGDNRARKLFEASGDCGAEYR